MKKEKKKKKQKKKKRTRERKQTKVRTSKNRNECTSNGLSIAHVEISCGKSKTGDRRGVAANTGIGQCAA